MPLTSISFFSGIGGFDLGLARAGIPTLQQIEVDRRARGILARHFPEADRSISDVRLAARDTLKHADVWTGGFPCQDLSVAGSRAGLAGERSGLYFEFQRAVAECRPTWVVLENVPGLLSSHAGRDFALVLGGLSGVVPAVPDGGWGNAGLVRGPVYHVAYRVLDARHFGVPQRRRRVFIVAGPRDGRVAEVLFEPDSLYRDLAQSQEAGQGAAAALTQRPYADRAGRETQLVFGRNNTSSPIDDTGSLTAHPSGRYDFEGDSFVLGQAFDERHSRLEEEVSGTLQSKKDGGYSLAYQNPILAFDYQASASSDSPPIDEDQSPTLNSSRQMAVFQQNQRDEVRLTDANGQVTGALNGRSNRGRNTNYVVAFSGGQGAKAHGLGLEEEVAPPLKAADSGSNRTPVIFPYDLQPDQQLLEATLRRLTPVECERLMGFPDDWTEWSDLGYQSDSARYRQLGNAVVVPVAEWIARRLLLVSG